MEKELESLESEEKKEESTAKEQVDKYLEGVGELCRLSVEKGKVAITCDKEEVASAVREKIEKEGVLVKPKEVIYKETNTKS